MRSARYTGWAAKPLCDIGDGGLGDARGLALVLSEGATTITGTAGELAIRDGDLLLSDPSALALLSRAGEWQARVLLLPDRRIVEHIDVRNRPILLAFDGATPIGSIIKRIWSIGDDIAALDLSDDAVEATIVDLITALGIALVGHEGVASLSSHNRATVERARLVIGAHLGSPDFGVAALSRHMRISPRHLSSLFAPLGLTTAQAILAMRLDRSRKMLSEPANARRQIASIALACGFSDQSYFTRCFARQIGCTPRQFRKENTQNG